MFNLTKSMSIMRKSVFIALTYGMILSFLFVSCSQNEIEEFTNESEECLEFRYLGKKYCSKITLDNNSVICEDKETQVIYHKLANNPNLAVFVDENGDIEYFDSYEQVLNHIRQTNSLKTNDNIVTRAKYAAKATVSFHADANYKGENRSFILYTPSFQKSAAFADLNSIRLLNKISSVKFNVDFYTSIGTDKPCVTLFDGKNFTGYSITWRIDYNSKNPNNIPDLSKIHRGPMVVTTTWDNAAQSAKIGFQ